MDGWMNAELLGKLTQYHKADDGEPPVECVLAEEGSEDELPYPKQPGRLCLCPSSPSVAVQWLLYPRTSARAPNQGSEQSRPEASSHRGKGGVL